MDPVGTRNLQIAQVSPDVLEVTIGLDSILLIEFATTLPTWVNPSCLPVLPKQVDRQQCASVKADEESALSKRLLDSGNNRPQDARHDQKMVFTSTPITVSSDTLQSNCDWVRTYPQPNVSVVV